MVRSDLATRLRANKGISRLGQDGALRESGLSCHFAPVSDRNQKRCYRVSSKQHGASVDPIRIRPEELPHWRGRDRSLSSKATGRSGAVVDRPRSLLLFQEDLHALPRNRLPRSSGGHHTSTRPHHSRKVNTQPRNSKPSLSIGI